MWKKLDNLLREHRFIVGVALLAVVVIGALLATERILLAMIPEEGGGLVRDRLGFWVNVITEVFGIGITIVIIERFNRRREDARRAVEKAEADQRQRKEDIKRIIREMRSPNADEGARAVLEAREIKILEDGTLSKVKLRQANLSGASLSGADLSGAKLREANLSKASLKYANLSEASLSEANLSGAKMRKVNLTGARLRGSRLTGADLRNADLSGTNLDSADLSEADLRYANLSGAVLKNANLKRVSLTDTRFSESTVMPDGTKWTVNTDMNRYNNPGNLDFWYLHYVAAGYNTFQDWFEANSPRPWVDAGYNENGWNEWVRDGKPTNDTDG
ncbi:MAG: pentapeptide repeat-containing protein, partial [Chloroflexota bacterium]